MTRKLTTGQIIEALEQGVDPGGEWDDILDIYISCDEADCQDAVSAARFLEQWQPGRTWSAEEFHGLMHNHFTGRWDSAAEIGLIRAAEEHADGKLTDKELGAVVESDEAAVAFLSRHPGSHFFVEADGTCLTFNDLYHGIQVQSVYG